MAKDELNCSVMMVTYNRLDLTKKTIESLKETAGGNYNLIIVDNGSSDDTVKYLSELLAEGFFNHIDLTLLPSNKGIAIGRNIALKKANDLGTQWYCTIDNDVKMPKNWLNDCICLLKNNKSFGSIGVNMEGVNYPLIKSSNSDIMFQEKPAGNLGTACMVFTKQLHKMIGFFNTEYGKYGEEDADFGMRARVAGFKLGYIEKMGIHIGSDEKSNDEYRQFKTKQHADNLINFKKNCALYSQLKKPLYIPYKDC